MILNTVNSEAETWKARSFWYGKFRAWKNGIQPSYRRLRFHLWLEIQSKTDIVLCFLVQALRLNDLLIIFVPSQKTLIFTRAILSSALILSLYVSGHVNVQKQWKILCQICMHNDLHMAKRIWFPKRLAGLRPCSPVLTLKIKVIHSFQNTSTCFNFRHIFTWFGRSPFYSCTVFVIISHLCPHCSFGYILKIKHQI